MRVALYERVSTQEQVEHGYSLDAQDEMLREWCEQEHHKIVGVYRDEGVSGKKAIKKRPELLRLLGDVEQDKIDLILFQKLDRWTRNVRQYYIAQELLDAHKVAWKALLEDYETITAAGRFKVNIMLAVAENEADRTSERIKTVFEMKRAKGIMPSGHVPVGYTKKDNIITFNQNEYDAIRAFFDTYLETNSVHSARQASQEKGLFISYVQADSLLKSPVCYGEWGAPAYITPEQHEQILDMRRKVARKSQHNRVYLFSGIIFCECGGRMHGMTNVKEKTGKEYYYYFCDEYRRYRTCQNSVFMNEEEIERQLINKVDSKLKEYVLKPDVVNEEQKDNSAKIASLRRKISRLKELYVNELITLEEFKHDQAEYEAEINKYKVVKEKRSLEDVQMLLDKGWKEVYNLSDRETKKGFWLRLLNKVVVNSKKEVSFEFN